jgi:hypothetical protein
MLMEFLAISSRPTPSSVSSALEQSRRHHRRKAVRGIINCEVNDGVWIVPPQCAVRIPGGLIHAVFGSGEVECCCLFIEPNAAPNLLHKCCTITISSLLRHLLIRANDIP